jgi:hypothetical protein
MAKKKKQETMLEDYNKGTSYRRKQEDAMIQEKRKNKKRSKRLEAYHDTDRVKSSDLVRNYFNGNYDEED